MAKIFLLLGMLFAAVAPVRRGDSDRQAIDMGDGSPICTSIGESNCVRARLNGVRLALLGASKLGFSREGESRERLLMSVVDGKSEEVLVPTDENWMLLGEDNGSGFDGIAESSRRCISTSTRD